MTGENGTGVIYDRPKPNFPYQPSQELQNLDNIFQIYIPPVMIVLGSIGNLLTLAVMKRKSFQNASIGFYLIAYAISCLLTLYLLLGSEWLTKILKVKGIDERADWMCRLWQFIVRVFSYSGIWFVVAMLIDRYIVIWHPKRANALSSKFMAKFVVVIIFVGLVVISIHAMWTYELMPNSGCYMFHREDDIHAMIWPWVSAGFYSYIPLMLVFVFNVLILTGLCLKRPWKMHQSQENTSLLLSYTTIGLSMLYFILVLPATVMNIVNITYPPSWLQNQELMVQIHKAMYATHYMAWLNTTILFHVCIVFSRTFRKEFWEMLTSSLCLRHRSRIYELQTASCSSGAQLEETCAESTPL
ncbi:hypothetical protein FSP39_008014 [Pinctada imbricata]|uniref:G-protein coupled receptors family 1 profile domain-containing protein n=1 Tax=Pinctada imbricata TaxID=66713 RepID=A0AA89BNV7_PINIB|nr:hypothetical protein FSP39_008014 [Pinctada imbricata]